MGLTRDETARRCSKSGGTVSGVWHELEALIGPDGQAASDAVIPLLKLNLSPGEAARGARIFSLMRRLGVKEEGIGRFVEELYEAFQARGRSAESIVEGASRLLEVEEKSGLTHEQILKKAEETAESLGEMNEQLSERKKRLEETTSTTQSMLKQEQITKEGLEKYTRSREFLKRHGLDIGRDLEATANMLSNARSLNFNAKSLVEEVRALDH